jgi:hypothetical protein
LQTVLDRPSAQIVPFPVRRLHSNRLTMMDRIQAMEWQKSDAGSYGVLLTIHDREPDDADEVGDYLAIYRKGTQWAAWCAAREGSRITVWHGSTGSDIGSFGSMTDALAAIASASLQPRARR